MSTRENIRLIARTPSTTVMVVIGEPLGDSLQRGRERDGRGYIDK